MNGIPEIGQTVLNFVGGRWEPATSDKWTDRYDPADQSQAGGGPIKGAKLDRGHFFAPTVLEARQGMEITREEIFGPVVAVIRVRDLDEAISVANSVRYGLTASIFTRDVSKVFRFAERAQAGMIHVNRPGVGGLSHAPFGGIKESGYGGREVGDEVMSFYTETKVVYVNYK